MKHIFTYLFIFLLSPFISTLIAQNDTKCSDCPKYESFMKQGEAFLKDSTYDLALTEFQAAQIAAKICNCNPPEPSAKILLAFAGIRGQRDAALASQRRAEILEIEARKNLIAAEQNAKDAKHQAALLDTALSYFFQNDSADVAWGFHFFTKKYGIINRDGKVLGDGFIWDNAMPFNEDYAIAEKNDSLWFVNKLGYTISEGYESIQKSEFPFYYLADNILIFYNGQFFEPFISTNYEVMHTEPRAKLIPFEKNNELGFVDKENNEFYVTDYDIIELFPNDHKQYAMAHCSTSWHLIDLFKAEIIDSVNNYNVLLSKLESLIQKNSYSYIAESGLFMPLTHFAELKDDSLITKRYHIINSTSGFGIINLSNTIILDSIFGEISLIKGDSIFLVTRLQDSVSINQLYDATTGLLSPFASELILDWENKYLIVSGPVDNKISPQYDYSISYDETYEPLLTFDFYNYEIITDGFESGKLMTMPMYDSKIILSILGYPLNKRIKRINLTYEENNNIGFYQDYNAGRGKQGLMKADGSVLTPPIFDEILVHSEGKWLANIEGKYGFIDDSNGWILPFEYDSAYAFKEDRAAVKKNNNWGFINTNGVLITQLEYQNVKDGFEQKVGYAKKNDKWGVINYNGNTLIDHVYDDMFGMWNGAIPVKLNGKWGYVDTMNQVLFPFTLDECRTPALNGWARIKKNGKWGFLNIDSFKSISTIYDSVEYFRGNFAWAMKDSVWSIIDTSGKMIYSDVRIDYLEDISLGYSIINRSDFLGVLDSIGNEIIPCNYSYISILKNNNIITQTSEGVSTLFSKTGKLLKEYFDYSGEAFSNGLLALSNGFLNQDGEMLLSGDFDKNLIAYRIFELSFGDKKGIAAFSDYGTGIDNTTLPVKLIRFLPPEYEEIGFPLDQEWLPVKKNGKWGFIHWILQNDGTELAQLGIPCKYDAVVPFIETINGNVAYVSKGYNSFFINEKDEIIVNIIPALIALDTLNELDIIFYKDLLTLDLSSKELDSLPFQIFKLRSLTELNISYNQMITLSSKIGELTNLTYLYIKDNKLKLLPEQIGDLEYLYGLNLSGNQLMNLPDNFVKLKNLSTLDLRYNQLNYLPEKIGELGNLSYLDVSENLLSRLPEQFVRLKSLYYLLLEFNHLDSLPKYFGELNNLTMLNLGNNQLKYLPEQFGKLDKLSTLYLHDNFLENLPYSIGQLTSLTELFLDNNKLNNLPVSIDGLVNLNLLRLSNNQINALPSQIGNLKRLTGLYLNENQLTNLPEQIGELENIIQLDFENNQLSNIPKQLFQLKTLEDLNLAYNQLTSLPDQINQLTNLSILNLTGNPMDMKEIEKIRALLPNCFVQFGDQ